MNKCVNLYYNQDSDYFVCATDDEVDMLDKRFIKLSVQPMDSLKNRMKKFLKHHQGGTKRPRTRASLDADVDDVDVSPTKRRRRDTTTKSVKKVVKKVSRKVSKKVSRKVSRKSTKKIEETEEEEKKEEENWNTGIEFKNNTIKLPICADNAKNYIVSFGFEYEKSKLELFRKDKNDKWKSFLLSDGRYQQKIKDKENELLEITTDTIVGGLFKEKYWGNPINYSFDPKLKDDEGDEIFFDEESFTRNGKKFEFDYLECIYTVKKIDNGDNINLNCFIKYDDYIQKTIQKFFEDNYKEINTEYNMNFQYDDNPDKDLKSENLSLKVYKPKIKNVNLPWMMCIHETSENEYCPLLKDLKVEDWSTQATVGINYSNIIKFMEELFSYSDYYNIKMQKMRLLQNVNVPIYNYEKESLKESIEISKQLLEEKNNLYNWLVLKLFYLNFDLIMLKLIKEYFWDHKPLDINKPKLKKSIDIEYEAWLKLTEDKKDKFAFDQKIDKRLFINEEYSVNKDTTSFQIRHSLYQVLYGLCDENVDSCLEFLNDIKSKLTNDYYIKDFIKGIAYFNLMKNNKDEINTSEKFKEFQDYNDPDLAIEENYGKIEPHTKYRIKYYNFSTKDQVDKEKKIKIIGNTLLFEIRNYGSLRKAIIQGK